MPSSRLAPTSSSSATKTSIHTFSPEKNIFHGPQLYPTLPASPSPALGTHLSLPKNVVYDLPETALSSTTNHKSSSWPSLLTPPRNLSFGTPGDILKTVASPATPTPAWLELPMSELMYGDDGETTRRSDFSRSQSMSKLPLGASSLSIDTMPRTFAHSSPFHSPISGLLSSRTTSSLSPTGLFGPFGEPASSLPSLWHRMSSPHSPGPLLDRSPLSQYISTDTGNVKPSLMDDVFMADTDHHTEPVNLLWSSPLAVRESSTAAPPPPLESPDKLFTPPPPSPLPMKRKRAIEKEDGIQRRPSPPKRRRQLLDFVDVPPAPYPIPRAPLKTRFNVPERSKVVVVSRGESDHRKEKEIPKSSKRSRSRPTLSEDEHVLSSMPRSSRQGNVEEESTHNNFGLDLASVMNGALVHNAQHGNPQLHKGPKPQNTTRKRKRSIDRVDRERVGSQRGEKHPRGGNQLTNALPVPTKTSETDQRIDGPMMSSAISTAPLGTNPAPLSALAQVMKEPIPRRRPLALQEHPITIQRPDTSHSLHRLFTIHFRKLGLDVEPETIDRCVINASAPLRRAPVPYAPSSQDIDQDAYTFGSDPSFIARLCIPEVEAPTTDVDPEPASSPSSSSLPLPEQIQIPPPQSPADPAPDDGHDAAAPLQIELDLMALITTSPGASESATLDSEPPPHDEPMPMSEKARGKQKAVDVLPIPSPTSVSASFMFPSYQPAYMNRKNPSLFNSIDPSDMDAILENTNDYPDLFDPEPVIYGVGENEEPSGNGTIDPALLGGGVNSESQLQVHDSISDDGDDSASDSDASWIEKSRPQPTKRIAKEKVLSAQSRAKSPGTPSDAPVLETPLKRGPKPKPKPKRDIAPGSKPHHWKTKKTKNVVGVDRPELFNSDRYFRYDGPPWPQGVGSVYCHHCRRKNSHLVVTFDVCGHSFCIRCVMVKFPPNTVPFESLAPESDCPKCAGTCPCDSCCNRRGEEYHALDGVQRRPPGYAVPKSPPAPRTPHTAIPATPVVPPPPKIDFELQQMVIRPIVPFSIMYNLDDQPVAYTYFDVDDTVVFNSDNTDQDGIYEEMEPRRKIRTDAVLARRKPFRRVFIGAVQESWNLGPNPTIFIDPPPRRYKRDAVKKRRFIGVDPALARYPPLPTANESIQAATETNPIPSLSLSEETVPQPETGSGLVGILVDVLRENSADAPLAQESPFNPDSDASPCLSSLPSPPARDATPVQDSEVV
ncbi:hypothetical protein MIND_00587800 [Mycena indigotica]|uniref:RING-type domain-containing protein n=1 Tax=Mycena indigotica TaxID=2126181 RepID=A0A8H6SR93_9AGAR|nr:uncharacterized protein MIND_00587800 [Mycena indigotica]KAF7303585.1 hypothetical protein MIND_00587800 [Mycena indigotica]